MTTGILIDFTRVVQLNRIEGGSLIPILLYKCLAHHDVEPPEFLNSKIHQSFDFFFFRDIRFQGESLNSAPLVIFFLNQRYCILYGRNVDIGQNYIGSL